MKKYTKEDLQELKRAELVEIAQELKIKNYSRKKKIQLINAVIKAQQPVEKKIEKVKAEKSSKKEVKKTKKAEKISFKEEMEKMESEHKEFSSSEEISKEVSDSRFDLGKIKEYPNLRRYEELPNAYGDNKIVLLIRDPQMIMAYWELTPDYLSEKLSKSGLSEQDVEFVLRLYKINAENREVYEKWDYPLYTLTRNYYMEVPEAGKSYMVDFGAKTSSGEFYSLVRSNNVNVPRETMSSEVDEEWITLADEDSFRKLYQLSGGEAWKTQDGSEHYITGKADVTNPSSGISSFSASDWIYGERERDFYLELDAKLTVTGKTVPDADVYIAGEKIQLNSDGSFSLNMSFPDGTIKIPVEAVSNDKVETRKIEPTFYRITRVEESRLKNQD